MIKRLIVITAMGIAGFASHAATIVEDGFSSTGLSADYWNDGIGYLLDPVAKNITLTSNGTQWGSVGDNWGKAGLNSTTGSATFTVAKASEEGITLGGFFQIGHETYSNYSNSVARIDLSTKGAGSYELVWNNSGATAPFTTASGWNGTIAGNSYVWIVDGNKKAAIWGNTDSTSGVTVGLPANRFGFYTTSATQKAVIDDVKIYDTPVMP